MIDKEQGVIESMIDLSSRTSCSSWRERFYQSVVIDEAVLNAIEECIELAPLHTHPNMIGIKACKKIMPNVPMVCFDTAFIDNARKSIYLCITIFFIRRKWYT